MSNWHALHAYVFTADNRVKSKIRRNINILKINFSTVQKDDFHKAVFPKIICPKTHYPEKHNGFQRFPQFFLQLCRCKAKQPTTSKLF